MIPYPGFVIFLGIGLATVLYYVFSDNENFQTPHAAHNSARSGTSDNTYNRTNRYPSPVQPRKRRSKRSETELSQSNASTSSNERKCMICLREISLVDIIYLRCMHHFHAECIQQWKLEGPPPTSYCCPICRMPYSDKLF